MLLSPLVPQCWTNGKKNTSVAKDENFNKMVSNSGQW